MLFLFHSFFQLPAQSCAVAMVSTPKAPACATVAGKVQNVTCPPASVLTPPVEVMVPASKGTVCVLWAIKERTVRKVGYLFSLLISLFSGFWSYLMAREEGKNRIKI